MKRWEEVEVESRLSQIEKMSIQLKRAVDDKIAVETQRGELEDNRDLNIQVDQNIYDQNIKI